MDDVVFRLEVVHALRVANEVDNGWHFVVCVFFWLTGGLRMGKMRGEDWRGMVRCKSKRKLRCTRFWFILVAFAKKYQCTGD